MKYSKRIASILLSLLLLFSLAACGEKTSDDGTITVTDMAGREIKLSEPATRIVALTAADCEILCAIGAQTALVGRGEYCDYPADIVAVESVQSGFETNIEQIIALEPQVVLMSTMNQSVEQIEQLEAAGIKVVVSIAEDIAGVYEAINIIGTVTGKTTEATELIDEMKAAFEEFSTTLGEYVGSTVYFEISPLEWGLWTAGSGTFMNEIAEMLGLVNIFADVEGWAEVSQEQVIERNPDFIITTTMYYGEGELPETEIANRSAWESISAVSNSNIYRLNSDEITRPGPRLVDAIEELYLYLYPDSLGD